MTESCGATQLYRGQRLPRCGSLRRGCRTCWTKYHQMHSHNGTQRACGLCGGGLLTLSPETELALSTDFDLS